MAIKTNGDQTTEQPAVNAQDLQRQQQAQQQQAQTTQQTSMQGFESISQELQQYPDSAEKSRLLNSLTEVKRAMMQLQQSNPQK